MSFLRSWCYSLGQGGSCGNLLLGWGVMGWCARVRRGILGRRGTVAIGAGHVEDDLGGLGVFPFGDGRKGAEELVGDVGEDGGAASGNFVLREEYRKMERNFAAEGTQKLDKEAGQVFPPPCFPLRGIRLT